MSVHNEMCKYHPDRLAIKEHMCGDCRVTYIVTTVQTRKMIRKEPTK